MSADTDGFSRRHLLTRVAPLGALGLAAACGSSASSPKQPAPSSTSVAGKPDRPLALVYRGPAGCKGCAEAVVALLESGPSPFRTAYCGPDEPRTLSAESLAGAALYAQPGGGDDLDAAWAAMRPFAGALRTWIRDGGHYVGFCMGGFLAGSDPGFSILPGDSGEYITAPGATVHTDDDAIVAVRWRGSERSIYFQGGPYFSVPEGDRATILGTYSNGLVAAMVAPFGSGSVGVTGPHPEAPASWYQDAGLVVPDPLPFDLGRNLVETTMASRR
jgi:glutamine amidotransferase-like uncharacterized protein